jgi:hypothetical protein
MNRIRATWGLLAIVAASTVLTMLAMRRTSTTFDEIVLIAGGARGYNNGGTFDLAPDHPPLMQYVYGLPAFLTRPNYPGEAGYDTKHVGYRYHYAQQFFWNSGNDPEQLAFFGRLPAVLFVLLLVLVTYLFLLRAFGNPAALIGAALVAFLPDVLAHGGVAYNDLPLALCYLLAIWALDTVVRAPRWQSALFAGATVGLAFGVKISAVALGPTAVLLVALQAAERGRDAEWWKRILGASVIAAFAAYLTLALIYGGDFGLEQFRYALDSKFRHVTGGHGASGFLLGQSSPEGFWFFFPVAFLFKTSAALHLLALIALVAALRTERPALRSLALHPLRAPDIGAAVFGAALLTSSLNIGFRYALPVLPLLCILIATGVAHMWRAGSKQLRGVIAVLLAWMIIAPLTYYPNFLAYVSEYGPGRNLGHEVLVDSSLDWGQGLLQLRDYLNEHNIDRVYLSYFGSGRPDGYGIDYVPLHSFFPLSGSTIAKPNAGPPTHIVISATNLRGVYFRGDPFAQFRAVEPEAVVARTMYVYRIEPSTSANDQ